jgi:hypothetical protein
MAKRFTASDKWEDAWFRRLPPTSKLFWIFILDRCNCAGFWKIDWELASFCIGDQITNDILTTFDGRIETIDERLWVTNFVAFQYGQLNENCNPHKPVIRELAKFGLLQRVEREFLET